MHTKTAFVASTLPARFLLDNFLSLKISRLICGSESLRSSFQFLKEKFPEVEILSVHSIYNERGLSLLEEVQKSKPSIVIFHECCWLELDEVIIKVQPVVEYFPSVTLDSWRKLASRELGYLKLCQKLLFQKNINTLKLIYYSFRYKEDFDFYEVDADNGIKNKSFQVALKESRILNLQKSNKCLISRKQSKRISSKENSKTIIFIVATDVVENKIQKEIFYKIKDICEKFEYKILVKDHPNLNSRLNLIDVGMPISPYIPFEVFEEPYFIKIGLFSTALNFEPEHSISIADLFPPVEEFQDRRKHLLSIPGGHKIKFIKNLDEFEKILQLDLKKTYHDKITIY